MKQSGLDLKYFRDTFKTLGPQVEKTFLNLIYFTQRPFYDIKNI
jgi:hypothetical protein